MSKIARQITLYLLLIGMFAFIFAGCATNNTTETTTTAATTAAVGTTAQATTAKDSTVYKINFYKNWSYLTAKEQGSDKNRTLAWIRDNFGVDIHVQEMKEDAAAELNLMRAQNKLPDVFIMPSKDWLAGLVSDGKAKDLTKYYNNPEYPNLAKIPKEYLGLGVVDGKIYTTFGGYSRDVNKFDGEYSMWLLAQKQLSAELGVSNPSTLTELMAYCEAVKTKALKSETGNKIFAIGGNVKYFVPMLDQIFGLDGFASDISGVSGFGSSTSGAYVGCLLSSDGKFVPAWGTKERYQSLMLLNEMWRKGYMDPEAFSQNTQVLTSKLANGQYALMVGSYGEADAFYSPGTKKATSDEKWAWREKYGPDAIGMITADGYNSIGLGYYSPFPANYGIINSSVPDAAVDKFMKWVDWKCSEDGMFSDYYEGWPGETWKYDDTTGKAVPWYSWWPNHDPKVDYVQDSTDAVTGDQVNGLYWQIHNNFTFLFNPCYVRLVLDKGTPRKINIWYDFIYSTTKTFNADTELSHLATPVNLLSYPKETNEAYAKMAAIYDRYWAKIITANSEASFEKNYKAMIGELVKTDVKGVSTSVRNEWNKLVEQNPTISSMSFPKTATPIDEIAGMLP